jgi:hypothetical protein
VRLIAGHSCRCHVFRKWTATWGFMGELLLFHFGRGQLRIQYGVVQPRTCSTSSVTSIMEAGWSCRMYYYPVCCH